MIFWQLQSHLDPLLNISEVKGVLEVSRRVLSDFGDLHHLPKFLEVAGDEVEEGELVKILGALVAHFNNLVDSSVKKEELNQSTLYKTS